MIELRAKKFAYEVKNMNGLIRSIAIRRIWVFCTPSNLGCRFTKRGDTDV